MLSTNTESYEYRKEFHSFYYKNILPILNQFEGKRKFKKTQQQIIFVTSILLLIGGFVKAFGCASDYSFQLFTLSGIGGIVLAYYLGQYFTKDVKKAIFKDFLRFFGDFTWSNQGKITQKEVMDSKLLAWPNITSRDCFDGHYKGLRVTISNCKGNKEFWGIFAKIELNKTTNSQIIVTQNTILEKLCSARYLMPNVVLEDAEFNKMFKVHSKDQTEARYILTAAFMERFKHLHEVFKAEYVSASFIDNSLYIAISCNREMFVLGDLRKPIDDAEQIQEFFNQFLALVSIVDLLKLDSKTGM